MSKVTLLAILLSAVQTAVCIKFHIMVSLKSQCPGELTGEPCLTLQQYVSYPSPSSNINLEFESGNHSLKSTFVISSKNYFGLIASANATVQCNGPSTITVTFSGVTQVAVKGITFVRCGAVELQYATNGIIAKSKFYGMLGSHSLYLYYTTNALIESCTFANNTIGQTILLYTSTAMITNSNFNGNRAGGNYGGAISSTYGSSLFIAQSKFYNNTAYEGGAIYFNTRRYTQTSLMIEQCSFISNIANGGAGGAVYVQDGYRSATIISSENTYKNNSAYNGGAIYVSGSSIRVSNYGNTFVNNTARYDGGALYLSGSSSVSNNGNTFIDNRARDEGGAMYVSGGSSVSNDGNSFINNRASDDGGAMYVSGSCINNGNSFTNNRANDAGGAVYVSGSITNNGSTFFSNRVNNNGGAIYASGNYITVVTNGSSFINNRATNGGGGALYVPNYQVTVTTSDCTFVNNVGTLGGGAIYILGDQASLTVTETTFVNNLITGPDGNGGAVNVEQTNARLIVVNDSVFVNNSATNGSGGAMYTKRGFSITNTIFGYNKAPLCAVLNIEQSIYDRPVSFTTSTFLHNIAVGSTVRGNIGGVGCIRNAADVSIYNSTFSHNTAEGGGGVFDIEDSTITIESSTFKNNMAGVDGGVLYTHAFPSFYTIIESKFINNRAGDDGGVIYVGRSGSFVAMYGNSFIDNAANDRGGAVALFGSAMNVTDTNMQNNMANLGDDVSACNSDNMNNIPVLSERVDPLYPDVCVLYDGTIEGYPEPFSHDDSDLDVTTYFQNFILGAEEEPTTTTVPTTEPSSTTGSEVEPILKEIQSRLFGTSVIVYLLFGFAIIVAVILIIAMAVKCMRKRNSKQKEIQPLPPTTACTSNEYTGSIELYEEFEPEWNLQGQSNAIPLKYHNIGHAKQQRYVKK